MSCFYFEYFCWDLYIRSYITYIILWYHQQTFCFCHNELLVYLTCNISDFRTLLSPKITRYDIIEKYYRKHLVCYNTVKAGCVLMKQNFRDVCTKVFVRLKGENHSVHLKKNPCNYQEQWMLAINLNGNRYTSICRMSFSTSEISITVLAVIFSAMASWIKRYGDISVIWL